MTLYRFGPINYDDVEVDPDFICSKCKKEAEVLYDTEKGRKVCHACHQGFKRECSN